MFCCLDWGNDPSSYPGRRGGGGFVRTGGNALARPQNFSPQSTSTSEVVGVSVPPGKSGGEQIIVCSPSGKQVGAIIPLGLKPGDTFMVEIPKDEISTPSSSALVPIQDYASAPNQEYNIDMPIASEVKSISPVPIPVPVAPFQESRQDTTPAVGNQKLVLVKVPPGVSPGSAIHVQVPGENRLIAAQVPPGVTEFHVAYEPQPQPPQYQQPVTVMGQPVSSQQNGYNRNQMKTQQNRYNRNNYGHANNYSSNSFDSLNNNYPNNNNYYANNQNNNANNNNNNNNNRFGGNYQSNFGGRNSNRGNGMGWLAPVLGGAALMGTAGYMVSHHHHGDNGDSAAEDFGGGDY
mmetsp:Transcript_16942/g.20685  ORF Transcript_16942/g.20685 Transcript_16942/m.20685 type:complete len:348 (-) Transcript_16942:296-1339(-)